MKLLIIEDSPEIVETVSLALEMQWPEIQVTAASMGKEAIEMVRSERPDVVLLDLGLPDISGFEVLKRVRQVSNIPVLILTVRADEASIVRGLEEGADDYMTKPFRQSELIARLKGVLRRANPAEEEISCGPLVLKTVSHQVTNGNLNISLSRTESVILEQLMRNPNRVVSNSSLVRAMLRDDFPGASKSIKVHIRHLREKLENDPSNTQLILTRPGYGYYLARPEK